MPPRKFTLEVYGTYRRGATTPQQVLAPLLLYDSGKIVNISTKMVRGGGSDSVERGLQTFRAVAETAYYTPTVWAKAGIGVKVLDQESTIKPIPDVGQGHEKFMGRHEKHFMPVGETDGAFLDVWWEVAPKAFREAHKVYDGYERDMICSVRDNPLFRAVTVRMEREGLKINPDWFEEINAGVGCSVETVD